VSPVVVGVTGSRGMLGWHVCGFLRTLPDVLVRLADRDSFSSAGSLADFVRGCDVVVHLAGMNRGDATEVAQTNVRVTQELVAALKAVDSRAHVLFSSSTHIDRDSEYGASKRECASLLTAWASEAVGKFTNLVLPNIFGERGKPFYNSVVSTFCHQVALGETPVIQQDAELEQIHAQSLARLIWDCVTESRVGELRVPGRKITVSGLLAKLQGFWALYSGNIFPDVRDDFDRDLFNTFRSYLYPARYPVALTLHEDPRGHLFEAVKTHNGGQTFMSTTRPGITRGNHFHTRKIERFLVVSGQAEIRLRRVFDSEVLVFTVSGDKPSYVDMPTLHTHNITNVGSSDLITLFWTHEFYDPSNPDTMMEPVEEPVSGLVKA
jgi:UDP-2-acetamido-2,6-beta-L-arabino-hexul-4-ose reductase